jgi:hypothetical protein
MTRGQSRPLAGLLGALFLLAHSLAKAADPPAPPKPEGSTNAEGKQKPPEAKKPPGAKKRADAKKAAAEEAKKPSETKKPVDAKQVEAAQRFDRGLQLFDDGDNSGALAEFKRTYEILPNPMVLYNIGLVYAAMARPVDAVDALEPAVSGGGLPPKQLERATQTLADQKARIGRLSVTTTPEGARIEVDNVEVAKTPLALPIRVSEGSHIVGAMAEGFAPARKEVVVAGNSDASLHLDLVSTQGKQLANLTVRTPTAGAEVRVDNEIAGKTPLATSLTLVAGHHVVELRRPGYTSARHEVDIGAGATGDLAFDLAIDPSTLGTEGATLVLDASESPVDLTVDGARKGPYTEPLRLPRGPHHLSIAVAGFIPLDRDVTLDGAQTNVVHVVLEPTTERRASYESTAHFHRTWGWVGIIGGAAIAGGGVAYLAINSSSKASAQKDLNYYLGEQAAEAANRLVHEGGPCDLSNGVDCQPQVDAAQAKYDNAKSRDTVGFVGIGVGGAVLITGVVLLFTGNDPGKYEHPASRSLGAARGPRIALVPGPGQVGWGLGVAF